MLHLSPAKSLERALAAASPRLTPAPTPLASLVLHGAVAVLFLAAVACAFAAHGLLAWATGLVYVATDIALMALVVALTWRPADPAPPTDPRPTLAVIVAAHNEAAGLPLTLSALFAQADPPDLILIADDGSRDGTAEVLARDFGLAAPALGSLAASATHAALRWLRLPHGGKARALDAALLEAATDIVLTIDGDTLVEPDAVGAFRRAFAADPRLVAAGGALVPACDDSRPNALLFLGRLAQWFQRQEYARNALFFAAWARMDALLHIPGAFAGFRRDALLAVGGFDPVCLVEDYELIHRLRRHGARHDLRWTTGIVAARAITDAPATIPAFLRQRRRWFCGFLETQFWYRDMVARDGRVGRVMLPIKAFDTLQPLHGLVALALIPVFALLSRWDVLAAAGAILAVKTALDLCFHAWAVRVRRRGGEPDAPLDLGRALAAGLVGLVSFQVLRHLGAALGWIAFLTGDRAWRPQPRAGLVVLRDTDAA